jgi:hypothetical protein
MSSGRGSSTQVAEPEPDCEEPGAKLEPWAENEPAAEPEAEPGAEPEAELEAAPEAEPEASVEIGLASEEGGDAMTLGTRLGI